MFEVDNIKNMAKDIPPTQLDNPELNSSFLSRAEEAIQNATKEYLATKKILPQTREYLRAIGSQLCVEILLTETDQEKVVATAKLIARIYGILDNPYDNILDSPIDEEIINLHKKMRWDQWGIEYPQTEYISEEKEKNITEKANLVSKEILKYYNLDPEKTIKAWREAIFPIKHKPAEKNLSPEEQLNLVFKNFSQLRSLEHARPGSASFLMKEFGLVNFGRYSLKMLVDQYDQAGDLEHPYGIIITARRDYNGAFFSRQSKEILTSLSNQIGEEYRIRILESGRKFSLTRSLINLNEKYGTRQKISFAMIRAHGNKESFSLGNWTKEDYKQSPGSVSIQDLANAKSLEKIREFFTTHATIIFDSCSTGKRHGVAKSIFERLGIRVLAPKKMEALSLLTLKMMVIY